MVPAGSVGWSELRKELVPAPVNGAKSAADVVEAFLGSGATELSFPSGIKISSRPFPDWGRVIPLASFSAPGVYVGLDLKGSRVLSVSDVSGESTVPFVHSILPGDASTYIDFATLDLGDLPPSTRREYGTQQALSFIRSRNLRYMVLENFAPSQGSRNVHPGIRYDMLRQIADQLGLFADTGRTLVLAGASTLIKPDISIRLDSDARTFTVGGLVFDWESPTR